MTTKPRGTTEFEGGVELRFIRNHTVIVLVSVLDRRIVPALQFVSRLAASETRALHIAVDPVETRRLATEWMNLGLSWLPLHIHDTTGGDVPAAVAGAIRREVGTGGTVTVVVPELDSRDWWFPLLHRRNARRIAERLQCLPGVTAVIVPFSVRLSPRAWRAAGQRLPCGHVPS